MKKILAILFVLATVSGFSACSGNPPTAYIDSSNIITTTEPTTIALLSDSFEFELASGYDAENNFYQLVANEDESYSGLVVSVAVLKNNELLIEPTSTSPFNDEDGFIEEKDKICYIGNGCFCLDETIWNVNTNQHFDGEDDWELKTHFYYDGNEEIICNNDGMFLYHSTDDFNYGTFLLVDSNDMTTEQVVFDEFQKYPDIHPITTRFGPYTDGLMCVFCTPGYGMQASYEGFYDLEGNKVIDLYEYDFWHSWRGLGFKNGKAVFKIENNAGTPYMITMDKTGAVIESVEIVEEEE